MELLFVVLGGLILGTIARYTFRRRESHGVILMPALGGTVAAVLWVALTWLGLPWDGGWIWVITLVGTAAVCAITAPALGVLRARADEALFVALRKA